MCLRQNRLKCFLFPLMFFGESYLFPSLKEHYIDASIEILPKSHSRYQKYDSVFDVLWLPIYYCSEILQYYNAMNRFWQNCIGLAADSNASRLRYHLCFCKFRPILKFIRKAIPSMNVCFP